MSKAKQAGERVITYLIQQKDIGATWDRLDFSKQSELMNRCCSMIDETYSESPEQSKLFLVPK